MIHPVRDAFMDMEGYALHSVRDAAEQACELYYTHLAQHNWDLNEACRTFYIRSEGTSMLFPKGLAMSRELADRITYLDEGYKTDRKRLVSCQPDYRVRDDARQDRFIRETVEGGKANFARFVNRLCRKVPETCNIMIAGQAPWIKADVLVAWEESGKDIEKLYEIYQCYKVSKFGNLTAIWREREFKFPAMGGSDD